MISLIWTKKNNLGSQIIRTVTRGESSHFAIAFDQAVVFESTINSGCELSFYSNFKERNQIVWSIDLVEELRAEELVWQACSLMDGMPYDYFGAMNLGLGLIAKRFDLSMLKTRAFENNRSYFCVEVAQALKPFFNIPSNLSLTTPDELFHLLKEQTFEGSYGTISSS